MAAKQLLPGFGGQYLSEAIAGGTTGADTLDCSLVAQLAFQAKAKAGNSTTITVEQTFDGTNWVTLTTFSSTTGTVKLLSITAGPFGRIRLKADGSSGTNPITVTGFRLPTTP